MWYSRLVADGGFIPLLANLVGLPLPVPSRAEEVSGDITELRTATMTSQMALWREWSTFDGRSWCLQL